MGSLPDVDIELVHRCVLADELDGGAGVEDVEASVTTPDLVECGNDARFIRDVSDQRKSISADFLNRGLDRRRVAIEQTDDRPFSSKRASGLLTDPAPCPGDDGDLALQAPHGIPPRVSLSLSASTGGCHYEFPRTPVEAVMAGRRSLTASRSSAAITGLVVDWLTSAQIVSTVTLVVKVSWQVPNQNRRLT
jgi:hypothetical protein